MPGASVEPPAIEHITQNYVPLKTVLMNIFETCGKELLNLLRTTENLPSNNARKEQFLTYLIAARQLYVKAYVLCKWAVVSKDISTSIDVANWLRGQTNCFNNVVQALFHLKESLGPGKAIHADIDSALTILKKGMPSPVPKLQVFMPKQPLDDVEVLVLLKRLDSLISVKLALYENLPLHYRHYTVCNGRARFIPENCSFWLDLSIADEDLESQCRFFFVDFGLDTANNDSESTALLKPRVEAIVNTMLSNNNLELVLDWFVKFSCNYTLTLINEKLNKIETGAGPWASVISHVYNATNSSITIKFFLTSASPGSAVIKVSSTSPFHLEIDPLPTTNFQLKRSNQILHLLSVLTKTHAESMLKFKAPWITRVDLTSVSLQLSPMRFIQLSVDVTSGKYVLNSPSVSAQNVQKKINSKTVGLDPLNVLNEFRNQSFMDSIAQKARTVGWVVRDVKLAPTELAKIEPANTVLSLTLPRSLGWSLCVVVSHDVHSLTGSAKWFVSKLQCVQRRWYLESMEEIDLETELRRGCGEINGNGDDSVDRDTHFEIDYTGLSVLKTVYTTKFVLYEFLFDLKRARIEYTAKHLQVILNFSSLVPNCTQWAHSGLVCTASNGRISLQGKSKAGILALFGEVKEVEQNVEISINGNEDMFTLTSQVCTDQLKHIKHALLFLNTAMSSFVLTSQVNMNLNIVHASLSSVEIQYAQPNGFLVVKDGSVIELGKSNPQYFLTPFLPKVSNPASAAVDSKDERSSKAIVSLVKFLIDWYPLCEFLNSQNEFTVLPQTLKSLRVQAAFDEKSPFVEISYRNLRGLKHVNYIVAGNGAETLPSISSLFTTAGEGGVVPLKTACAVDVDKTNILVDIISSLSAK